MRARAIYVSELPDRVFFVDGDGEAMSITNDAEDVVANMHRRWPGRRFIYRDTQGEWGELLHDGPVFKGFGPYDEELP